MGSILIFVPMLVIMYFLMIRPQQKKMKEHQALISSLAPGDEVVTNSGIYGIVSEVDGDVVWLEVAQELELKVRRSAVEGLVGGREVEAQETSNTSPIED